MGGWVGPALIIEDELFARFLPDPATALTVVPVAVLAALIAAGPAIHLRRRGVAAPYTRKLFHFAIFTGAALVHVWRGTPGVVTYGGVITLIVLDAVVRRTALFGALARPTDAPHERWFIVAPLLSTAAGGLLSNLLFGPAAVVGYLVAGWGDAVAEPVGTRWGRHRYRVHAPFGVAATRSYEGTAAVLIAGTVAAVMGLVTLKVPAGAVVVGALAIGVVAAIVEAVSTHGLDNLTVQIAASGVASGLMSALLTAPMT